MNGYCDQCEVSAGLCNEWITVEFEAETWTAEREFCRIQCLAAWSAFMAKDDDE